MIPTMLVVGLALGLLPRRWPNRPAVTVLMAVVVSLAFGFLVGHPLAGGALALANAAIGVVAGRAAQRLLRPPAAVHRHRAA